MQRANAYRNLLTRSESGSGQQKLPLPKDSKGPATGTMDRKVGDRPKTCPAQEPPCLQSA